MIGSQEMNQTSGDDKQLSWSAAEGKALSVRQLRIDELGDVYALCKRALRADMAPIEAARRVLEHNPDAIWGVYRVEDGKECFAGFLSFLLLTNEGEALLRRGQLNVHDPDTRYLVPAGQRPAVGYIWLVVAPRVGGIAIPLVTHAMGRLYRALPLASTAATEAGARTLTNFGFHAVHKGRPDVGNMFWRDGIRAPAESGSNAPVLSVTVAHTATEFDQARAVRAAVFMAEQDCPYAEEFDGNDYTATHFVGYIDDEPAATLRVRYFGTFAKIERLAVLRRFRGQAIADEIIRYTLEFLGRKGYKKAYGHPQERLVPLWAKYGFRPMTTVPEFVFSDHAYVAVEGDLEPHGSPIAIDSDPYMIVRPEGLWDQPGILDRSVARPATNPHVEGS